MERVPAGDEERLLLAGLRQGQAHAFEQLMRRYNRLLYRAARGILHDNAEAQDVVQETWLRAFQGLASFRGDASLATWLTRIAIHQALDQHRKLGRTVLWDGDPAQEDEMPRYPSDLAPTPPSPEQELARQQVRRRIEQAIDLLPPIYRAVFILRAVQGLAVEDTAQALQVSADVVKTRYLRARAQLREQLDFDPETEAAYLHDFAGARCDDTVAAVLARLRAAGVIRDQ
ncbi:MAG TPA: RNA polymerase sigma factor [Ramlibacter sp.]|uniref:RNA polymerase sigma factor n=1 Tax=Ramlibacter sp. TaxID=1917967 RepID=UPI002ED007B2